MKVLVLTVALLLLVQLGLGQPPCYCTTDSCSCAASSDGSANSTSLAPGNPRLGSREFLTPTGDRQSPSSVDKPVRAANRQQYIWAGASMISSSDDSIVLVSAITRR